MPTCFSRLLLPSHQGRFIKIKKKNAIISLRVMLDKMQYIVSVITSPTFSLSKFIASIISPLAGKTNSYVKNSSHFKLMISEETIGFDEII